MTASNLALRTKAKAGALKSIAKELALLLAASPYRPASACHIAGLTNVVADALSRRFDPAKKDSWKLPAELLSVKRTDLPTRDSTYYILHYSPRVSESY